MTTKRRIEQHQLGWKHGDETTLWTEDTCVVGCDDYNGAQGLVRLYVGNFGPIVLAPGDYIKSVVK